MPGRARLVAVALGVWGAVLAAYSYWVLYSIPLTALGIGAVIVAASILSTYEEAPYSEATRLLLESYAVNVARILEEFGAREPALYTREGITVVPLNGKLPDGFRPSPERLVSGSRGSYVLTFTLPRLAEEAGDAEAVLRDVLVDVLGLCDGVRVARTGERVLVELVKPKTPETSARFESVLGPLPAHVAAAVLARSLGVDLKLEGWRREGSSIIFTLRALSSAGEG